MKYLGECGDFVGVEILNDVTNGVIELKNPKYWLKAAKQFEKYFPNGFKRRGVPLTVADERNVGMDITDDDFNEASHLPYREILGTISYPASCVKPELRHVTSVLGRFRKKWGQLQWKVLMKAFEYGYCTRDIGLIYSKGLDPHGVNTLYAYADSAHSLPRSQGCEIVMMNGAAICVDSRRHAVTCTSTCHDELLSFNKATKKCSGFRSLMQEAGMYQNGPTIIY